MMKKWIMMAALLGCLFAGVSTVQAQEVTPDEVGYIVKVGDEAPDFEMTLTDGQKVKLSSLRGKVVMLQFTAAGVGFAVKKCLLSRRIFGRNIKIILHLHFME